MTIKNMLIWNVEAPSVYSSKSPPHNLMQMFCLLPGGITQMPCHGATIPNWNYIPTNCGRAYTATWTFFLNLSGTAHQLPKEETVIYPIYWVWHRCYLSSEEIDVFKEMVLLAKYGAGFFFGQGMWHYIPLYTEMVLPSNNDKNWIWTGMLPLQQGHVILQQVAFHILQQYCFCGLNKWLKPDDDSITEHASVWRNNMFIKKKRNSNIVLKIQCI
jgi:hypothetical protein